MRSSLKNVISYHLIRKGNLGWSVGQMSSEVARRMIDRPNMAPMTAMVFASTQIKAEGPFIRLSAVLDLNGKNALQDIETEIRLEATPSQLRKSVEAFSNQIEAAISQLGF